MINKILIIDDSPVARKILRSCMPKDRAFEIQEAGDGLSGLRLFETINPDVTFVDLTMPIMTGVEALEKMKALRPEAIIVVCSADVQPRTIEMVMSLGAFTSMRKPPSKELVTDVLAKIESLTLRTT
ncbi:MAG: Regulatory protein AtoC [Syntrophus sp. SKADARSKE-3]|nr:Regulatory protein AtoC [Syntrophus sp. SKADARSKE-3]